MSTNFETIHFCNVQTLRFFSYAIFKLRSLGGSAKIFSIFEQYLNNADTINCVIELNIHVLLVSTFMNLMIYILHYIQDDVRNFLNKSYISLLKTVFH